MPLSGASANNPHKHPKNTMKPTSYKVRASGRIEPFQSEKDAMEFAIFAHRAMKSSVTVMEILPDGVEQIIWRNVNETPTKRAMREVLEAFESPDSPEALVGAIYQLKRIYNQIYDQTTYRQRNGQNRRVAEKRGE